MGRAAYIRQKLNQRLDVLTDSVDLGKAEFVPLHRAPIYRTNDERVSIQGFDLHVKTVATQENIRGSESDALVAVEEAVVFSTPTSPKTGEKRGTQRLKPIILVIFFDTAEAIS